MILLKYEVEYVKWLCEYIEVNVYKFLFYLWFKMLVCNVYKVRLLLNFEVIKFLM